MSKEELHSSSEEDSRIEDSFHNALKKFGYVFPETEEELEHLKATVSRKKNHIPDELNDPFQILKNGRVTALNSFNVSEDHEIEENLAMAAREGKEIPEDIRRQMEQDRKDVEEKGKKNDNK
jgi:branched-subunit amino acid aminotransferase/4-amino-4-deoxychorismate lyase